MTEESLSRLGAWAEPAPARYIYGVVPATGMPAGLGGLGLDQAEAYLISYQEIAAVVHNCPETPYQGDDEQVKEWLLEHSRVVDLAWEKASSIIPMSFDVIVKGDSTASADDNVRRWLQANYDIFQYHLARLADQVELGVQVFVNPTMFTAALGENDPEIQRLRQEMAGKPKGMAYFYQQKIEKMLKAAMDNFSDRAYQDYYHRLAPLATEVEVNKPKPGHGEEMMLLNLSLLVVRDNIAPLGEELDRINQETGVRVRFTGPWPPYSFVRQLDLAAAPGTKAGD